MPILTKQSKPALQPGEGGGSEAGQPNPPAQLPPLITTPLPPISTPSPGGEPPTTTPPPGDGTLPSEPAPSKVPHQITTPLPPLIPGPPQPVTPQPPKPPPVKGIPPKIDVELLPPLLTPEQTLTLTQPGEDVCAKGPEDFARQLEALPLTPHDRKQILMAQAKECEWKLNPFHLSIIGITKGHND